MLMCAVAFPNTIHLEIYPDLGRGWRLCGYVGVFMFFQRHVVLTSYPQVQYKSGEVFSFLSLPS